MYRLLFIAALLLCGAAAYFGIGPLIAAYDLATLQKEAAANDAEAQYKLGRMYADGEGVAEDEAEAVKWYRKSAMQGHAWGQYKMAQTRPART